VKDGEALAITNLAKALKEAGATITMLCMNTPKHPVDQQIMERYEHPYSQVEIVEVDTRVKPIEAFKNLFSSDSYHIERFCSEAYAKALEQLLQSQSFDAVQLETLYLAPYIPLIRKYSQAKIVMRAHNIEHEIWKRITDQTAFFPKRWYLSYLTRKLQRFEQAQFDAYDLLAAISDRDLEFFRKQGYQKPGVVVPIGLPTQQYLPDPSSFDRLLQLSFIGSLDWMPNAEGMNWFLEEVWPSLHIQYPDLTLHIAGRNTPDSLRKRTDSGLIVHGEVDSAQDFINDSSIMIVPLFSGSGMRVKILEGMALGKVVLTTTIGLEGIPAKHQQEVLIADTKEAFIDAIAFAKKHPAQLRTIGANARKLIEQKFEYQQVAKSLLEHLQ